MNRYETTNPRAAFGLAAVAMTVITIAMMVVVPATLDSRGDATRNLASRTVVSPAEVDAASPVARRIVIGRPRPYRWFRRRLPTRSPARRITLRRV